jgi:hypothetical protein
LIFPSNAFAQLPAPAVPPPPSAPGAAAPMAKVERVVVTGRNIPTAEETGPNPVDTYRPQDIEKLSIRSATDLGASNDMGEWEAWIKAGTGDDKTDSVVVADFWERTGALFNANRDISPNGNGFFNGTLEGTGGTYAAYNFAAVTPDLPPRDRQVYYGSFTRDLWDRYLTVFAAFKHSSLFFDASLVAVPFTPDPFHISGTPFPTVGP